MKQIVFKQISPKNWQHPADKAALNALKKLKGFDELVKKVIGITTPLRTQGLQVIH